MNRNQEGWNASLLSQLFCFEDIQAIRNTPINILGIADRMMWSHTKDGQYTMKLGYKLAKDLDRRRKGDEGTSTRRGKKKEVLWNRIWSMNIKKRVQHFLWRACHNKISMGANLRRCEIKVDGLCHQCGEEVEPVEHVLFQCQKTQLLCKLALVL